MKNFWGKYYFLIFAAPALFLTLKYIKIPIEFEWNLLLFLGIMVVFDQVNLKVFSGFGYSFFNVILSLIIFDIYSIVYGFLYLLLDTLFLILMKKGGSLQFKFSMLAINIIVINICNQLYNEFTDKQYFDRYLTLLLMLTLSIILKYLYSYLESGAITSKFFIDIFGPIVFEVVVIFPIVAFLDHIHINIVLILFLSYYTFIGFLHRKLLDTGRAHIDFIMEKVKMQDGIKIIFLDLKGVKGVCMVREKMILIDEKLDYPEQFQTIIHELFHYRMRSGFQLHPKVEEMVVTLFEAAMSWYYIITIKYKVD